MTFAPSLLLSGPVGGLVGRDHHARGRRLGVDEPEGGVGNAVGEQPAPRSQHQRVDEEYVLVDEVAPQQRLDQLSAPSTTMSLPGCSLSPATASAASPARSVELSHASGSFSVVDATYFWLLFRTSVNGLSVRLGQTA